MPNKKKNIKRIISIFLETFAYVFTIYSIIYDLSPRFHLGFENATKWNIYTGTLVSAVLITFFIAYPAFKNKKAN